MRTKPPPFSLAALSVSVSVIPLYNRQNRVMADIFAGTTGGEPHLCHKRMISRGAYGTTVHEVDLAILRH
jgi:hypothetical protein